MHVPMASRPKALCFLFLLMAMRMTGTMKLVGARPLKGFTSFGEGSSEEEVGEVKNEGPSGKGGGHEVQHVKKSASTSYAESP